jgi:hypothetical protein
LPSKRNGFAELCRLTEAAGVVGVSYERAQRRAERGLVKAQRNLPARVGFGPLILKADGLFRSRNKLHGEDPEFTNLKGDKILLLIARGFEEPCGWSLDEAWHNLYSINWADDDEV